MLEKIESLTENMVIINEDSIIDYSQWKSKRIHLFTTLEWLSSVESKPDHVIIYVLAKEKNNQGEKRFYSSIDRLIAHLLDRIVENYYREIHEWKSIGEFETAKRTEKKLKDIYTQIRMIHMKNNPIHTTESLTYTSPVLFWLRDEKIDDEEDRNTIEDLFGKSFSQYRTFVQQDSMHNEVVLRELSTHIFIVIHASYPKTLSQSLRHISNVKCVLRYGVNPDKTTTTDGFEHPDDQTLSTRADIEYRLNWHLIKYCYSMAEQYRAHNQLVNARDMIVEAKRLCNHLSVTCFKPIK